MLRSNLAAYKPGGGKKLRRLRLGFSLQLRNQNHLHGRTGADKNRYRRAVGRLIRRLYADNISRFLGFTRFLCYRGL